MATYPITPTPSMVSAPEVIDPMWSYRVDQGYEVRRAKHSRRRRRWTLEYLGKSTDEMRQIRDFLQAQRLGALDFAWHHPTALDKVTVIPTVPASVLWRHGLVTGDWCGIRNSPNPTLNEKVWQVTRIDSATLILNGSMAAGVAGPGDAWIMVPHAVGIFQEGVMASPTTLIGPEQVAYVDRRSGFFSFSVQIEETF